jgi:hypothetical protein
MSRYSHRLLSYSHVLWEFTLGQIRPLRHELYVSAHKMLLYCNRKLHTKQSIAYQLCTVLVIRYSQISTAFRMMNMKLETISNLSRIHKPCTDHIMLPR